MFAWLFRRSTCGAIDLRYDVVDADRVEKMFHLDGYYVRFSTPESRAALAGYALKLPSFMMLRAGAVLIAQTTSGLTAPITAAHVHIAAAKYGFIHPKG